MDAIADLIVRIKNGSAVGKETVSVNYSKIKEAILTVLEREGYVKDVSKKGKKIHKALEFGLVYDEYGPRVKGVERVSKLSKRLYSGAKELRSVKQGHGVMLISTPKGILTDSEARKEKVGGELLFKIW
jgi:small subunit ribosomal protein S8